MAAEPGPARDGGGLGSRAAAAAAAKRFSLGSARLGLRATAARRPPAVEVEPPACTNGGGGGAGRSSRLDLPPVHRVHARPISIRRLEFAFASAVGEAYVLGLFSFTVHDPIQQIGFVFGYLLLEIA